jgi:hypothetical protein
MTYKGDVDKRKEKGREGKEKGRTYWSWTKILEIMPNSISTKLLFWYDPAKNRPGSFVM